MKREEGKSYCVSISPSDLGPRAGTGSESLGSCESEAWFCALQSWLFFPFLSRNICKGRSHDSKGWGGYLINILRFARCT